MRQVTMDWPFWDGEHPLAARERRQDVVVQVGGHLDHPAGVAGGADAAALAGEAHEALGGAVVAPDSCEAVGQDAASQVCPEVLLDPARHALAPWLGLGGPGQEGLEVVLDDRVEGCGGGPAAAVDGGEAVGRGGVGVVGEPTARRGPGRARGCDGAHAAEGSIPGGARPWPDAPRPAGPALLLSGLIQLPFSGLSAAESENG
jgi:hypothetical protein